MIQQTMPNFESQFFQYELPVPIQSIYNQDYVRSNDLRLLIEIATKSSLRMHTDSKTGYLHFTCKQKGANCFDIQAFPDIQRNGYFFAEDYLSKKHSNKQCHQLKEAFRYLQIYNLMKLKKHLLQEFMIKNDIMKQSPSIILSILSGNIGEYFFEKYINGHLEFKRKLRKRFDNIVNIDIKNIGKSQEKQNDEDNIELQLIAKKLREQRKEVKIKCVEKVKIDVRSKQQRLEDEPIKLILKSKKIKKQAKPKAQNSKNKKQKSKQSQYCQKSQEYQEYHDASKQDLPEIKVLNEQVDYIWSSSSSQIQQSKDQVQVDEFIENKSDYFKSLRNSALKKSLEKQSLTSVLFSSEPFGNKHND